MTPTPALEYPTASRRGGPCRSNHTLSLGLWSALLLGVAVSTAHAADRVDPRLRQSLATLHAGEVVPVWVVLADKGHYEAQKVAPPLQLVSERSLRRRLKVLPLDRAVDAADLPVEEAYVHALAGQGVHVRQRSKWLNRVSVDATAAQIDLVAALPFVRSIEPLARFHRRAAVDSQPPGATSPPAAATEEGAASSAHGAQSLAAPRRGTESLDYGTSLGQLAIMNVPALHAQGISGQNVLIGHFDNGYRLLAHQAFATTQIVATHDFVDGDTDPAPPADAPSNFGAHGINTLSTLAGFAPGNLIGVAYGASYVLARTENDASETPLEEDNWVAAIEWADSLGIDVASTSLGYLDFDPPFTSYTYLDMNGNTTVITRAADMAVARGIVVFNSAGNSGGNPSHNTLLAPSDGDSVIAVGAVQPTGERSNFSSVGPTTDVPPRFKPDIMAQGRTVRVASSTDPVGYGSASGTSFSCPLAAGVGALLLSARPSATPMQIRDALRLTATNAASPDNLIGWGTIDATAALAFLDATDVASQTAPPVSRLANYPNPFNPATTIAYLLDEPAFVSIAMFDPRGRLVRTWRVGQQDARPHTLEWNGRDDAGHPLPSGVYVCRLSATHGTHVVLTDQKKMTLLQ